MAKNTEQEEPAREAATPKAKQAPGRTMVHLVDNAGNAQLRFLAREIRMRDGRVVGIKTGVAKVRLTAGAGEIAVWGDKRDVPPTAMITSEGYRRLNQVAGITVYTPSTIDLAKLGKVANPYVETAEGTGAYRAGWVRKIAVGPTPLGNLAICDRTTYLSLIEYLLEDLIGVAKKNPCAAVWGVKDLDPGALLADAVRDANADLEERAKKQGDWLLRYKTTPADLERALKRIKNRTWGFLEVEQITGQGLWFDRTSEAIAQVMGTYVRTGKFGVRKLEAIAYRNVLSDHPLMPKKKISPENLVAINETVVERGQEKQVAKDYYTDATVFYHEAVEGKEEMEKVLRDYEEGLRTAATITIDADSKPERASKQEDVGDGEDDEQTREERDAAKGKAEKLGEEDEPAAEPTRKEPAPAPDPVAATIAMLKTTEGIAGDEIVKRLLAKFPGIKKDRSKATIEELRAYGRALEAAINQRDNQG